MLPAGTRLGPYTITELLGVGGMGEVYRAEDGRLRRDVAIKVLPPHLAFETGALERFRREARSVASLSHPNILSIFDFGEENGLHYAVTEYLDGETLRTRMGRGRLSAREALQILLEIAEGVAAAHARGLVHRDLKPENVFITTSGRVKVLDFGLARGSSGMFGAANGHHVTETMPTEPGMVMGTLGYMAPEQLEAKPLTAATDVFALGCTLYEMVEGKLPFDGASSAHSMAALLRDPAPRLDPGGDSLLVDADLLVQQCLIKDPAQRLQNAGEVAAVVRSILTGETMRGRRSSFFPLLRRRRRWKIAGIAAILLFLAATAAVWYVRKDRARLLDHGFDLRASDIRANGETRRLTALALRADADGNRAKAIELLEEAHRRSVDTGIPAAFLSSYSEAAGDERRAHFWTKEAMSRLASGTSTYESLLVRYLVNRSLDSERELALSNSILEIRPDAWRMRLGAAHIHLGRRDNAAALAELRRIDVTKPDDRRLMLVLADRASLGDVAGAERDLARSRLLQRPALMHYVEARIAWSRGDVRKARDRYDTAAVEAAAESLGALEAECRIMSGLTLLRQENWPAAMRVLAASSTRAKQLQLSFRELESNAFAAYAAHHMADDEERDRKLTAASALTSHIGHSVAVRLLALRLRSPVVARWKPVPDVSAHAALAGGNALVRAREAWLQGDFAGARRHLGHARAEGVDTTGMREEAELLAAELGLPYEKLAADPPYPNILRFLAIFDTPG